VRRLVIDTASRACSVALFEGLECIAAFHEVIGRGHAERLVPMISQLPDRGLADCISVNVGPGSFTGIRVGISAAKALALAWNIPCEGYSSLALLAAFARDKVGADNPVDVAIQGGHGEYYFQPFDAHGNALQPAQSLEPEAAAQISRADIVVGDAADALVDMKGHGTAIDALPDARNWLLIGNVAPLAATAAYVRPPDAKLPGGR
jgi:tRNA threonylcarbamoyl adenosine modification protein YeaZ